MEDIKNGVAHVIGVSKDLELLGIKVGDFGMSFGLKMVYQQ